MKGQKKIENLEELDVPYRIVIVRGRVVFPIRAIQGLEDLARWYEHHSDLVGLHTHSKTLYRAIKGDNNDLTPLIGEFLAGIAIKAIGGGIPGDFTMDVKGSRPGESNKILRFGHELTDAAQTLNTPTNRTAKSSLQRAIQETIAAYDVGEYCMSLHGLSESISAYKLTHRGNSVDSEKCSDLLYAYIKSQPNVYETWIAIQYKEQQLDSNDYYHAAGTTDDDKKIYPVDGFYCPKCRQLLARAEQKKAIPSQCEKCFHVLRLDLREAAST